MSKLTIDSLEFDEIIYSYWRCVAGENRRPVIKHIDVKLAEAYEQGKKDAQELPTIEWKSLPDPSVPRSALYSFIPLWCDGEPSKISLATAAFYACAKAIQGTPLLKEPA